MFVWNKFINSLESHHVRGRLGVSSGGGGTYQASSISQRTKGHCSRNEFIK